MTSGATVTTGTTGSSETAVSAETTAPEPTADVYTMQLLGSESLTLSPMNDDDGQVWWRSTQSSDPYHAMLSPSQSGSPAGSPWRVVTVAGSTCTVASYVSSTGQAPPLTGWSGGMTLARASPAAIKQASRPQCRGSYLHPAFTMSGWQSLARFGTLEPKMAGTEIWWQTKQVDGASVAVVEAAASWSLLLLKAGACETLATQPKPTGATAPVTGSSWRYADNSATSFSLAVDSSPSTIPSAGSAPGTTCPAPVYPTFSFTNAPAPLASALGGDRLLPYQSASGVVWWRSPKEPYVAIVPSGAVGAVGPAWSLVYVGAPCLTWATLAATPGSPLPGPSGWSSQGVAFDFATVQGQYTIAVAGEMPATTCAASTQLVPAPKQMRPAYMLAGLGGVFTLAPVRDAAGLPWWVSAPQAPQAPQARRVAIVPQASKWQLVTLEGGRCVVAAEAPKIEIEKATWSSFSGAAMPMSVSKLADAEITSEPVVPPCTVFTNRLVVSSTTQLPEVWLSPRSASTVWYYGELASKSGQYTLRLALVRTATGWALFSLGPLGSLGQTCVKVAETSSADAQTGVWTGSAGAVPISVRSDDSVTATVMPLPACDASAFRAEDTPIEVSGEPAIALGRALTLSPMLMAGNVWWQSPPIGAYTSIAVVPAGADPTRATWMLLGVTGVACVALAYGVGADLAADVSSASWTVLDGTIRTPISMPIVRKAYARVTLGVMPHFLSLPTPSRALLDRQSVPIPIPVFADTDRTLVVTSSARPQIPVSTVLYPRRATAASKVASWWEGELAGDLYVAVSSTAIVLVHRATNRCHLMASTRNSDPVGAWSSGLALAAGANSALVTKAQPPTLCDDTTPHLVLKGAPAALQAMVAIGAIFAPVRPATTANDVWRSGNQMWWQAQALPASGYTSVAVQSSGSGWQLTATKAASASCETLAVGAGASPVGAAWSVSGTAIAISFELAHAMILTQGTRMTECAASAKLAPPAAPARSLRVTSGTPYVPTGTALYPCDAGGARWWRSTETNGTYFAVVPKSSLPGSSPVGLSLVRVRGAERVQLSSTRSAALAFGDDVGIAEGAEQPVQTGPVPDMSGWTQGQAQIRLASGPAWLTAIVASQTTLLPCSSGTGVVWHKAPALANSGYSSVAVVPQPNKAAWDLIGVSAQQVSCRLASGSGAGTWTVPSGMSPALSFEYTRHLAPAPNESAPSATAACQAAPAPTKSAYKITTTIPILKCERLVPTSSGGATRWVGTADLSPDAADPGAAQIHIINVRVESTLSPDPSIAPDAAWIICCVRGTLCRGLAYSTLASVDPPAIWTSSWRTSRGVANVPIPAALLSVTSVAGTASAPAQVASFASAGLAWTPVRLPISVTPSSLGVYYYYSTLTGPGADDTLSSESSLPGAYKPEFFRAGVRWFYPGNGAKYPDLWLQRWVKEDIALASPSQASSDWKWVAYKPAPSSAGWFEAVAFARDESDTDEADLPPSDKFWYAVESPNTALRFKPLRGGNSTGGAANGIVTLSPPSR